MATGNTGKHMGRALPESLFGIGVSPGIAIGRVKVLKRHTCRAGWYHIPLEAVDSEILRFKAATHSAEKELLGLRCQFEGELADALSIIDSHILMLKDRMLLQRTIDIITQKEVNAEWALAQALTRIKEKFASITDPYLKERYVDIKYVADRLFGHLSGKEHDLLEGIRQQVILVANDFSPEDIIRMHAENVLGFITEAGGSTTHASIVAKSLNLPSIIGLNNITGILATGDTVILDGLSGRLFLHPTPDQIDQYREYDRQQKEYSHELAYYSHLSSETFDGLRVRLSSNIEMIGELPTAMQHGTEGVGLFRSEFDYFHSEGTPNEKDLVETYREMLETVAPFPVTVRTLDVGGDKFYEHLPVKNLRLDLERNPSLGLRSIRFSLKENQLFRTQIRALLKASVYGNLRILLPMITSLAELRQAVAIIDEIKGSFAREGCPYDTNISLGGMVEVPSAVMMANEFAREVDFFSIGTNDLIQYTLAVDRGNPHVAHMYDPFDPAVLRMIKHTVTAGHENGIEVAICGEMAGDVMSAPVLLGLGVDELSMRPSAIPHVKRILRNSSSEQLTKLGQEVMQCTDSQGIRDYLAEYLPHYYPEEFGRS